MCRFHLILLSSLLWLGASVHAQEKTDSARPVMLTEDGVLTYESNGLEKAYKKVLVASYGDHLIRYVADNIYMTLKGHYDKRNISHASSHLGNSKQTLGEKLNTAVRQHQPDAVLTIYESSSKDTVTYKDPAVDPRLWNFLGGAGSTPALNQPLNSRPVISGNVPNSVTTKNTRTSTTYIKSSSTRFMAVLVDPAGYKVLWKGEIFIFSNTAKNRTFEKISTLLVDEWVKTKILEGPAPNEMQN